MEKFKMSLVAILLAAASVPAVASVSLNNQNKVNGSVNLECTASSGDVLEVDTSLFPQFVTFQADDYKLSTVKTIQGWKVYDYQNISTMQGTHKAVMVQGEKVVIQDQEGKNYVCSN